jgi:hypothetical protein
MFDLLFHSSVHGYINYHAAIKQNPQKIVLPGYSGNTKLFTEMVNSVAQEHHLHFEDVFFNYYMKMLFVYFDINFDTKSK